MNVTKETSPQNRNLCYRMKQVIFQGFTRLTREGTDSLSLVQHQKRARERRLGCLQKLLRYYQKEEIKCNTCKSLQKFHSGLTYWWYQSPRGTQCFWEKPALFNGSNLRNPSDDSAKRSIMKQPVFSQNTDKPFLSRALNGTVILKRNRKYLCVCILNSALPLSFGAFHGKINKLHN